MSKVRLVKKLQLWWADQRVDLMMLGIIKPKWPPAREKWIPWWDKRRDQ